MDSIKGHWREWDLFEKGRIPVGHMHSDLLQIALERGVPALIAWLVLLGIYARTLWRLVRRGSGEEVDPRNVNGEHSAEASRAILATEDQGIDRGIALGALGGLAGFFTSGLVHYNWGDSEVVMVFYFIMALCVVIDRQAAARRQE
jgi:O-antigen ligase